MEPSIVGSVLCGLTVKKDPRLQVFNVREASVGSTSECTLACCISFLQRLLWEGIAHRVAQNDRNLCSQFWRLEAWSQGAGRAAIPLRLAGILRCAFLASGGGPRPGAFPGLQPHDFRICLRCHLAFLCLCLDFPFLRKTPVVLD